MFRLGVFYVALALSASPLCIACVKGGADAHEGADKPDAAAQSEFEKIPAAWTSSAVFPKYVAVPVA